MFSGIKSHVTEIINKNTVFINSRVRCSFPALSEITPLRKKERKTKEKEEETEVSGRRSVVSD